MAESTQWYEQIEPGVRRIFVANESFEWIDIDLDVAESKLGTYISNPDLINAIQERFMECGRMRFDSSILFRIELPEELLDGDEDLRISLFIEDKRIIVARRGHYTSLDGCFAEIVGQGHVDSPLIAACEVVDDILDLFRNPINTTSSDLDDLEDALLLKKIKRGDEPLAKLRQRLLLIDRHVDLLQAILRRTLVDLATVVEKNELSALRELAERTAWFEQRIGHQLDRVRVVTDQSHMTAMDDLNDTMYRLTLIATVFLPLTFITGLLGINVGGIPGNEPNNRWAFWIVCGGLGGLAIVTFFILARILRKRS